MRLSALTGLDSQPTTARTSRTAMMLRESFIWFSPHPTIASAACRANPGAQIPRCRWPVFGAPFAPGEGTMDHTLAHVRGAEHPPLREDTIGLAFAAAVSRWPEREALVSVHQDIRWTWAELGRRVDAVAAAFLHLGLEPGDRVGIWAPNCAEWAVTQFATAKAGLILVNINPAYRAHELAFTLNKVGVKALVCAGRFKTSDYPEMLESVATDLEPRGAASLDGAIASRPLPHLKTLIKIGGEPRKRFMDFEALYGLATDADRARLAEIGPSLSNRDAINIQFTSGTTGLPKGATLSHRNILNNGWFVGRAQGLTPGERICVPVPLYHCFGMVLGTLAAVSCGAAVVYPAAGCDPLAVLQAIQAERCTALYCVPFL